MSSERKAHVEREDLRERVSEIEGTVARIDERTEYQSEALSRIEDKIDDAAKEDEIEELEQEVEELDRALEPVRTLETYKDTIKWLGASGLLVASGGALWQILI